MGKAKKSKQKQNQPAVNNSTTEKFNRPKELSFPRVSSKETTLKLILGNDIFTVGGMLSLLECEAFVQYAESLGFLHQGSRGAAFQEAVRDNDRVSIENPSLAEQLWKSSGLSGIFASITVDNMSAVGLNPNIRFYRYTNGQKFGRHIDESVVVEGAETKYTLLIYLSGKGASKKICPQPLLGGETVFYGKKNRVVANIAPEAGMALLHIHGNYCQEHEGKQVTNGIKYVLRSDVLFQKN